MTLKLRRARKGDEDGLYQIKRSLPMPSAGEDAAHFRTLLEKCLEILQGLQGHTSGLALPHLVVDLPNGGGRTRSSRKSARWEKAR